MQILQFKRYVFRTELPHSKSKFPIIGNLIIVGNNTIYKN